MRLFGFDLGGAMPDENTIRHYRNRLTESGTLEALMQAFELQPREAGYLALTGPIVDARWCLRPSSEDTEEERAAIKAGKPAKQIWRGKPNKAHQKDVDARWTIKIGGKIRYRPDRKPLPQIAMLMCCYKSHISIDRRLGFVRKAAVTSAADTDGRQLRRVIDAANTAGDVWADSAYRSSKNEAWFKANMLKSRIHRRKPKGKLMPEHTARANAAKSAIRARGEHVFAHQKSRYDLFIRTMGIARAQAKLTLVNLANNFDRLIFQ
jgi:IS5 family transposase